MEYTDRIYGKFNITEPVILELIGSPTLQRLKGIDQAGYKPLWVKPKTRVNGDEASRYAHSLGVYLLLRRYHTSLEEQIAGLIHDVSHSAFSHCIDYVLDSGSETEHSHQDRLFDSFVRKSEIPEIISRHGFDLEYILNDINFPLKENELPDICADRIDYSLRMARLFGEVGENDLKHFLDSLMVRDNWWTFANLVDAKRYAELFLKLNTVYFASFPSAVMFRAVGDCLKYALKSGYISEEDLYTTDEAVLEKIKGRLGSDKKLNLLWSRMNGLIKAKDNPVEFESQVFCKSRVVDPLFRDGTKITRLSAAEPAWGKVIGRESKPKQYFLKFDK